MYTIRLLSGPEAEAAAAALSVVLADCVNDDASVGFMQPYGVGDAAPYWAEVGKAVAAGATLLFVAEVDGVILGTVQVGLAADAQPAASRRPEKSCWCIARPAARAWRDR